MGLVERATAALDWRIGFTAPRLIRIRCLAIAFVGVATQFVLVSLFAHECQAIEEVGQSTNTGIRDIVGKQRVKLGRHFNSSIACCSSSSGRWLSPLGT